MTAQSPSATDVEALRRHVAHHLYGRFAFASFIIWTLGTLMLFILFAAGNPRPVFPAMISMTTPLIPAFLIWIGYRPMVSWQVARRLRAEPTALSHARQGRVVAEAEDGRDEEARGRGSLP